MGDDQKKSAVGVALLQEALHPSALKDMAVLPGVKVKNTFINGFDDEETPRPDNLMTHATTWANPVRLFSEGLTPTGAAPQEGEEQGVRRHDSIDEGEEQEAAGPPVHSWASLSSPDASTGLGQYWGQPFGVAAMPAPAPVYTAAAAVPENNAQLRARVSELEAMLAVSQAPVVAPAAQPRLAVQRQAPARPAAVAPPAPSGVVTPLPRRQPEASAGSDQHPGACRPCAWFWKPQGCAHSSECGYCHMCPEGELKARKKDKASHQRDGAGVRAAVGAR